MASTPDFTGQPAVANGASDLFGEVFGDVGPARPQRRRRRGRCRVDAPVEVELVVEV